MMDIGFFDFVESQQEFDVGYDVDKHGHLDISNFRVIDNSQNLC